jgi:hypothetical protein
MRESSFNVQPPSTLRLRERPSAATALPQDLQGIINKEAFKTQIKVLAIRVPAAKVGLYRKEFQKSVFLAR